MIELILATPNLDNKMRVEVDTLDYVIGEVLLMRCEDKK